MISFLKKYSIPILTSLSLSLSPSSAIGKTVTSGGASASSSAASSAARASSAAAASRATAASRAATTAASRAAASRANSARTAISNANRYTYSKNISGGFNGVGGGSIYTMGPGSAGNPFPIWYYAVIANNSSNAVQISSQNHLNADKIIHLQTAITEGELPVSPACVFMKARAQGWNVNLETIESDIHSAFSATDTDPPALTRKKQQIVAATLECTN